jgi:hypothetical protein
MYCRQQNPAAMPTFLERNSCFSFAVSAKFIYSSENDDEEGRFLERFAPVRT